MKKSRPKRKQCTHGNTSFVHKAIGGEYWCVCSVKGCRQKKFMVYPYVPERMHPTKRKNGDRDGYKQRKHVNQV